MPISSIHMHNLYSLKKKKVSLIDGRLTEGAKKLKHMRITWISVAIVCRLAQSWKRHNGSHLVLERDTDRKETWDDLGLQSADAGELNDKIHLASVGFKSLTFPTPSPFYKHNYSFWNRRKESLAWLSAEWRRKRNSCCSFHYVRV